MGTNLSFVVSPNLFDSITHLAHQKELFFDEKVFRHPDLRGIGKRVDEEKVLRHKTVDENFPYIFPVTQPNVEATLLSSMFGEIVTVVRLFLLFFSQPYISLIFDDTTFSKHQKPFFDSVIITNNAQVAELMTLCGFNVDTEWRFVAHLLFVHFL